ncbi:MAG: tetratricopeptide repeat protein [Betaproteobacteria bacterium]|nr:tetratricopeptide repeat protein [Betaproteobacteria bacterium]
MSLINKMLQDLDRRQAQPASEGVPPPHEVRAVLAARERERWVVRGLIVALIVAAVAWMAWVAYQLQLKPLATEMAMHVAQSRLQVASRPVGEPQAPHVPPSQPTAPQAAPPQPESPPHPAAAPQPALPPHPAAAPQAAETFKLATTIASPVGQGKAEAGRPLGKPGTPSAGRQEPAPAVARKGKAAQPEAAAQAEPAPRVEKRERQASAAQSAQWHFHRAIALLNEGRVSEAEDGFITALQIEPSYQPARQALVALLLDQRRVDDAQRLLQEGLALDPKQTQFATVLARILAGRGDYSGALTILERAGPPARSDPDFDLLRATVLQRLSQHARAVEAYRAALQAAPDNGAGWVGLGISLEALERPAEALEAYRRALATNSLGASVRRYAEERVQQLQ